MSRPPFSERLCCIVPAVGACGPCTWMLRQQLPYIRVVMHPNRSQNVRSTCLISWPGSCCFELPFAMQFRNEGVLTCVATGWPGLVLSM